ncbi:putative ribonuclease H-like domain-containing protein [Tanacetum coccineum]
MAGEYEFHDDNPPHTTTNQFTPTQQAPSYFGQPLNSYTEEGKCPASVSTDKNRVIKVLPPKTAKEILARERERKAMTTLLMALPEDHLAKFHKMTDAKETWDAIKSRFGGNDESKKMQKYILKQPFKGFSVSNSEGLHKGYDRFQSLMSQLEIHGAGVSTKDDNQKFLRVFESDVKGSTGSSSSAQNVAFVSSESTSSTNDVSTAYGVLTSSGYNSQRENSSSYTDELMYSFFANQSSSLQLDREDLKQFDEFDLEEMDLKWQVAMISMRLKKFYKKTGRRLQFDAKKPIGFDKTKVECFNCHKIGHFARECRSKGNQESRRRDAGNTGYRAKDNGRRPRKQEEPKSLVTLDGEGVDWTGHAEDEQENFALMAYNNSGLDTEVTSCSNECVESYAKLKKLYDEQRELGDASIEIQAYTQALKKVEAQLVAHHKNQLWYEEKIRFMKIDLDDKTDVLTYHKKLLAEVMSTRDKSRLGYGNQIHKGFLSYEKEVLESVFDSRSSNVEDSPVYDRFEKVEGMHAVPPPMTGNYMPPKSNFGIDESNFTHGPKQSKTSESDAKTSDFDSCKTNSSMETLESMLEPVIVKPKVVSQPKVWSDAPIIEEYESDSDDEYVIEPSKEQEKPSFAFVNTDDPQKALKNKGIVDSGCSRHMTRNKAYLVEYQDYNGGPMCDKKNKVLFTNIECLVLSPDFKFPDENQVLLRVPRQNNMYSFNLENIVPTGGLACLIAKATIDESNKWHRRLGHPVTAKNKANKIAGPKEANNSAAVKSSEAKNGGEKPNGDTGSKINEGLEFAQCTKDLLLQARDVRATSTNTVNTVSSPVSTASLSRVFSAGGPSYPDLTNNDQDDSQIPAEGAVADFTNLETIVNVSPIPTSRIHSIHLTTQILGDPTLAIRTRSKVNKSSGAYAFIEPKNISQALEDESWVDVMQEELLQFKIQKVWILVDLSFGKKAIMTKWVYRNKKDERGVTDVKSAFLYGTINEEVYVSQPPGFVDPKFSKKVYKVVKALYGLHQAPRAWYTTLSTFLLKSGYKRGTIDKTFFIKKDKNDIMLVQVYVDDIIFSSTKKSWCDKFEALMKSRFQMSSMGELTFFLGLQFKQKEDGIFISQDKYVAEILKKFDFANVNTASTPIETQKPLIKDEEAVDVDVHFYRSMIGSLMYLTASRPDIMFAVCACSRFQVTPKTSHLHAVKRIFRYLKGKPKLGLWYLRVSSFDLEAYSDSDYARANLDRKSTTGGCQFIGRKLISWQCKKQTIMATSTTEAEYVAAANCCGQILWIQNQMLDYGFNFMNTKIYIDNESTICIVKNPVIHSKTKHIEIRHHFIRDAYEKKLIQVLKIHTNDNVADLLTKAFNVSRFNFLSVNIGLLNL